MKYKANHVSGNTGTHMYTHIYLHVYIQTVTDSHVYVFCALLYTLTHPMRLTSITVT